MLGLAPRMTISETNATPSDRLPEPNRLQYRQKNEASRRGEAYRLTSMLRGVARSWRIAMLENRPKRESSFTPRGATRRLDPMVKALRRTVLC